MSSSAWVRAGCGKKLSPSGSPVCRRPLGYERWKAITVVRALCGGGVPVTFDGEFYNVTALTPAAAPTPPIWVGALGPRTLAVTGRHADGWIPGHLADWRSREVAESRPIVDEAAASIGRDPADVDTIYNVSGRLTRALTADPR